MTLTFWGIQNHSLTDIFAKMDNICINHNPIIAQQVCERNFDTIQDALHYLESMIDPETDNIYNAQYYDIVKSMLGEYCSQQIDKKQVAIETKNINSIVWLKEVDKRIAMLKDAHEIWKQKSLVTDFSGEVEFCNQKYLAYDMLDLSQDLFIKQLKKRWLLTPKAILPGDKLTKMSDKIVLDSFSEQKKDNDKIDINYLLASFGSTNADDIANIIKNISVNAAEDSLNALKDMKILTDSEKTRIKDKLEIGFVSSCGKNQGYHTIKQYYSDNDVLKDTTLEEIRLDISLCDSYQYIDQLEWQVKKLLIHEIWHYMYYFKDKSANKFETICWNKKWDMEKNKCETEEFVSKYSQTSAEEDYAETFSRRALTEINKDKKYLSYYRRDNEILSSNSSVSNPKGEMLFGDIHSASYIASSYDSAISKKFSYFDNLLVKSSKQVVKR